MSSTHVGRPVADTYFEELCYSNKCISVKAMGVIHTSSIIDREANTGGPTKRRLLTKTSDDRSY